MENDSKNMALEEKIQSLEKELLAQKKVTKNALKISIIVGVVCFFFVALNLSILFTLAGGIAGNERKVQSLQNQYLELQNKIEKQNRK